MVHLDARRKVDNLQLMGIEFKLTDRELPISPAFVGFLSQVLQGRGSDREIWADQLSETLVGQEEGMHQRATEAAQIVMASAAGRRDIARAYSLCLALLTGEMTVLRELQSRFQFISVIGIPRTGGSYLTAEIYRSLRMVPEQVPNALAHDSFPELGPFQLQPGLNSWLLTLKTMGEYLTMVETFFAGRPQHGGRIVVPKKFTKAVYAGALCRDALGDGAQYILTVRHPAAACLSTYEKSGGLPGDGNFSVRSNIEEWCRRDLQHNGLTSTQIAQLDYFDAYLRYWELYHLAAATTGLFAGGNVRVVAFGRSALQSLAQSYHERFASGLQAAEFHVSDKVRMVHPDWIERAQPSIERIIAIWGLAGLQFPIKEIRECW